MSQNAKPGKGTLVALVVSGGGMKCAYSAGAMTALVEHFKLAHPDIVIAESGAAGSATYYVTGQYKVGTATWLSLVGKPDFIQWSRIFTAPIINIDYLIDTVFKKMFPIDVEKISTSATSFFVPLTRVRDGALVYMTPPPNQDAYEVLRAAKALPFVYGKEVQINNELYIDGGFGGDVGDHLAKAVAEGATTIIYINNSNAPSLTRRSIIKFAALIWQSRGRKGLATAAWRELTPQPAYIPPNHVRIITLRPSTPLPLTLLSSTKFGIREAINIGYDDVVKNPELEEFFAHYVTE